MIAIPLYFLLFIYIVLLAVFVAFMILNFHHIIVGASLDSISFGVSFLIFILTVLTLYFTFQILGETNWKEVLLVFDKAWLGL